MTDLDSDIQRIVSEIAAADPVTRHRHLEKVHEAVSRCALTGKEIPRQLRQLQEDLTNEAIEAQFDNMPV